MFCFDLVILTLKGDVKKTIEFFITDDTEPEDNETLQIGLVRTEGGSRIQPSSDTVTILILANDNAAGLVGFNPSSRSAIVREGEIPSAIPACCLCREQCCLIFEHFILSLLSL